LGIAISGNNPRISTAGLKHATSVVTEQTARIFKISHPKRPSIAPKKNMTTAKGNAIMTAITTLMANTDTFRLTPVTLGSSENVALTCSTSAQSP
jgi:hypothetical protein